MGVCFICSKPEQGMGIFSDFIAEQDNAISLGMGAGVVVACEMIIGQAPASVKPLRTD
jgi:hypothetical protein